MSDDDAVGDNDADKRPRIYGKAETPDKEVEVTVQGSEGETTADLEETFEDAVDRMAAEAETHTDTGCNRGGFR